MSASEAGRIVMNTTPCRLHRSEDVIRLQRMPRRGQRDRHDSMAQVFHQPRPLLPRLHGSNRQVSVRAHPRSNMRPGCAPFSRSHSVLEHHTPPEFQFAVAGTPHLWAEYMALPHGLWRPAHQHPAQGSGTHFHHILEHRSRLKGHEQRRRVVHCARNDACRFTPRVKQRQLTHGQAVPCTRLACRASLRRR